FCEFILHGESKNISPEAREYVERIGGSALRMKQIVNDLMRLSIAGSLEIKPVEVDLSLFARVTARELQKDEPDRSTEFCIDKEVFTIGSERLLWMVLENLLSNAWKATRSQPDGLIEFGAEKSRNSRRYFVRDNGIGFDVDKLDQLFVPFTLMHHPDDFPGTGLGLVTARRIIARHRGRIWAESRENAGSVFYFTLGIEKR
ncbi:MAG: ATP-binding protein, partial [Holophagales bacterium]|nr:ATP-binding protein [Holophagales bacterium]